MTAYILRRLLLMVPTILGITLIVFVLIQLLPGGPVEQLISQIRAASEESGGDRVRISEQELENINAYYGFDKPAYLRYVTWLWNIIRGDLGTSYVYKEPVGEVILSKIPVSATFGITSFVLSYLICIPLGFWKALSHRSLFDVSSSIGILIGYVLPGYAAGILMIMFFGSYLDWFPISGFVSDNFERLGFWGKALDILHHMTLPLIAYMLSQFALLTLLMRNSLLDELNKDYMKTALVKGLRFDEAARKHALRNALIPLATNIGEIFTILFASTLLIERVFDLDGMGKLFFDSMVGRDYNVVLALIFILSILTMLGRLFSDISYVIINPRIKFD